MAVTQYIGARYVPLVCGTWDSTKSYEPLSIVLNEGNSYTSLQAVPAGIAINNEQYWVCTGNYNAQVESYRQEVARVYSDVETALQTAETLNTQINGENGIVAEIDGLENSLDDALDDIDARFDIIEADNWVTSDRIDTGAITSGKLASNSVTTGKIDSAAISTAKIADGAVTQDKINVEYTNYIQSLIDSSSTDYGRPGSYFSNYGMVVIGDSYAVGSGASTGQGFVDVLAERINASSVYNFAVGSTGFCDPGSSGQNKPFPTQATLAQSSLNETEAANVHLCIVAGGLNDFRDNANYSPANMRDAAAQTASTLVTAFPNAYVIFIPMLMPGYGVNSKALNYEKFIIMGIKGRRRVGWIKGAWSWLWGESSYVSTDNLHPTNAGHAQIAYNIARHLSEGGSQYYYDHSANLTYETGYATDGGCFFFYNGMVTTQGFSIMNDDTLAADVQVKIAEIGPYACPAINISTFIVKSGNIAGTFTITPSGNVYVKPNTSISGGFYVNSLTYIPYGKQLS